MGLVGPGGDRGEVAILEDEAGSAQAAVLGRRGEESARFVLSLTPFVLSLTLDRGRLVLSLTFGAWLLVLSLTKAGANPAGHKTIWTGKE
jgi:hypothetical protein